MLNICLFIFISYAVVAIVKMLFFGVRRGAKGHNARVAGSRSSRRRAAVQSF